MSNQARQKALSSKTPDGADHVRIRGEFYVKNGATEFVAQNRIVNAGLKHLMIAAFYGLQFTGTTTQDPSGASNVGRMELGTGGGATTESTSVLTTPVGVTNPDTKESQWDNPGTGIWRGRYTAVWNAGTLSAVGSTPISEIAVIGRLWDSTSQTSPAYNQFASGEMFSRLSDADGEFTAFVVDHDFPLTIEYRLRFEFI